MTAIPIAPHSREQMERIRLLRSSEIARDFDKLIGTELTYEDLRTIVTGAVFDESERLYFLRVIDWAEERKQPLMAIRGLKDALRNSFRRSMLLMDDTSLLGSIYIDRTGGVGSKEWRLLNTSLLAMNLRPAGQFVRIVGLPRTGKTNVGCLLAEEWVKQGGMVITNIRLRDTVPYIIPVETVSGMLEAVADAWDMGLDWVFEYDEAGLTYIRARAMSGGNISMDRLARVVGKFGGRMVVIEQRESSIPTIIEEFSQQRYSCERIGSVSIDLQGPEVYLRERYHGVPRSGLDYVSEDPAFLRQDCDIEAAIAAVTGARDRSAALRIAVAPKPKRAPGRPPKHLKAKEEAMAT